MENFEKMIKDIGFGRSVVALEKQLPTDFWDLLTIEQLIELCSHITSWDSDLRKKALLKMEELGASTNQWWQLYMRVPWHLKLLENKLRAMVKAKTIFK